MKMVITMELIKPGVYLHNKLFYMHKVLLSIGSNSNACFNMEQATNYLLSYFPNIKFTSVIETEPHGAIYKDPFLNALAYFETDMSKEQLLLQLKTIEKEMGRQAAHKAKGKIIIDIDLAKWDNDILKPDDFERDYMHMLMLQMQEIVDEF